MTPLALVWHRRDLRVDDNPALTAAAQTGLPVAGVFVFDPAILYATTTIAGAPMALVGGGKVRFMLDCLTQLRQAYRKLGSDLFFFQGDPVQVWPQLATQVPLAGVFFNEDVEPAALVRDRAVSQALAQHRVPTQSFLDIGLVNPATILTKTGEPYKVFTPFWKNWQTQPKPPPPPHPPALSPTPPLPGAIALPTLADLNIPDQPQTVPPGGEAAALALLTDFCESDRLFTYQETRNFPSEAGTSRLSPHLRFGTVGIRRVWAHVLAAEARLRSDEARQSWQTWQQELCWREFYQHVLLHFPELETGAYRPAMQNFPWENNPNRFWAWCQGRTGYPIVDAAMQELHHTGWMHNRCRMIVASFLTKNLLVTWQWGEAYFMQQLLDGDLAANNGGWQWSASSGMDPKPLRIFNPYRQSQQFDPEATYIKQWLPELRHATADEIHSGALLNRRNYPLPIVDRRQEEQRFKERYRST